MLLDDLLVLNLLLGGGTEEARFWLSAVESFGMFFLFWLSAVDPFMALPLELLLPPCFLAGGATWAATVCGKQKDEFEMDFDPIGFEMDLLRGFPN